MQSTLSRPSKTMPAGAGNGQHGNDRYSQIFHFFGLRENPFNINPNPRYMSFTRQIQEAFDAITCGIQSRQGLLLLTGEVGTGKTTLTNYLREWLYQRQIPTSFLFNARLSADDLIDFVLAEFGIKCQSKQKSNKQALLTEWLLKCHRAGKTPILIVDEAQGLPLPACEELRLLLNLEASGEKLLQIMLVGQPELEQKLGRPELRHLRERVMVRCKIGPLDSSETLEYIRRRLYLAGAQDESVFLTDAMEALHTYSLGIPRVINILCEHALISAYADQIRPVSPHIVKEVAEQFQFDKAGPTDARSNIDRARRKRPTTSRSVSTLVRASSGEVAQPATTEQRNRMTNHARVPAVDKYLPGPARAVTSRARTANTSIATSIAERAAAWRHWMSSHLHSLSVCAWRWWQDKGVAMAHFSALRDAALGVLRWLQQPARPARVRRTMDLGPAPAHPRPRVTWRGSKDLSRRDLRGSGTTKARLES